jgi:hypothetical protein
MMQARSTKHEIRNKFKIGNQNVSNSRFGRFANLEFRFLNLFRISCFGFGIFCFVSGVLFASETPPIPRIVGGTLVPASDFPSVGIIFDSSGTFSCSGTLIDPTHVLTAGHCATDMNTGKPLPDLNGRFELNGTVYQTSHIFVHPSFNINLLGIDGIFDAAIFELNLPVVGVTPSAINRQPVSIGTKVVLAGYGLTGSGKAAKLKHAPPPGFISKGSNIIDSVSVSQLTWTYNLTSSSNAPGDSGGPAFVDNGDGNMAIAGLTSEGETDGNKISFGARNFDTRVDTMTDWIDFVLTGSSPNQSPVIVSPISTDQNPASAGQSVQFSVAAVDPDNTTLLYVWDYGDGLSDLGATPNHVFAIPGTYNVSVTATDGVNAAVSTATIVVNPLGLGALSIDKLQIGLNFSRAGNDTVAFQADLNKMGNPLSLPAVGVLRVGHLTIPVQIDSKGRGRASGSTFVLDTRNGKFTAQVRHGNFGPDLGKDGLLAIDVANAPVTLSVDLVLNGIQFSATRQALYSARLGRSGRLK